jgi:hypothetical protein
MNKLIPFALAAAALLGTTAAYSSTETSKNSGVTIEFNEPQSYTDFQLTPAGTESQRDYLVRTMRQEIDRAVNRYLPPGYPLTIRINDVDMAGEFRPELGPDADTIRIMRAIDPPRVKVEYALADADGNVIASGNETLTDMAYTWKVRRPNDSEIRRESELVENLVRDISNKAS